MSFTLKILSGLFLGILTAPFSVAGEIFIGLLQMTVLPYIVVSLIGNIGAISWSDSRGLLDDEIESGAEIMLPLAYPFPNLGTSLPFAFLNDNGEVVGFEIEMASNLASDVGVELELGRIQREDVGRLFQTGQIDIVMSGLAVTPSRAMEWNFSKSPMDLSFGLLVPDHKRNEFSTLDRIRLKSDLTLGVVLMDLLCLDLGGAGAKKRHRRSVVRPLDPWGWSKEHGASLVNPPRRTALGGLTVA